MEYGIRTCQIFTINMFLKLSFITPSDSNTPIALNTSKLLFIILYCKPPFTLSSSVLLPGGYKQKTVSCFRTYYLVVFSQLFSLLVAVFFKLLTLTQICSVRRSSTRPKETHIF